MYRTVLRQTTADATNRASDGRGMSAINGEQIRAKVDRTAENQIATRGVPCLCTPNTILLLNDSSDELLLVMPPAPTVKFNRP